MSGLKPVFDLEAELEREKQHLEKSLQWLKDRGDDDPSSKHAMIADNQVLSEMRRFEPDEPFDIEKFRAEAKRDEEERRTNPDWWIPGFIFRTRRDVLHARLDVADSYKRLRGLDERLRGLEKKIDWIIIASIFCAVMLAGNWVSQHV